MRLLPELNKAVKEEKAVLLYFQNDACAPCRTLRPKVHALIEEKYPKVKLKLIDPMQEPDCAAAFQVFSLPTILIFFDGKEFFRGGIYTSIMALDDVISRYYELIFEPEDLKD